MQREERKKRYTKDFTRAFTENGIDKTSIKKLAGAANINEASIYQYFKNKDDIVGECVRQLFSMVEGELSQVVTDASRPLDERLAFVLQYSESESEHCAFVCQVLANPLYSRMCRPIIDDFINWMYTQGESISRESGIDAGTVMPLMFLYCSAVSSGRVLSSRRTLAVQTDFLTGIVKKLWQGGTG